MDVLAATPAGARLAPTRSGKRQYSMLRDTEPDRKVRIIALFAMVLALVGGLSLFNKAHGDTEPPTVVTEPPTFVATSCSGFEADAHKLFDKGDIAALSGTFAPGDHVHLAIDFKGVGYSWELTGVLGKTPDVRFRWFSWFTWFSSYSTTTTTTFTPEHTPISTVSHGKINGFARLEVEIDVATAGEGAITINKTSVNKTSSMPFFAPPRVAIASCNASKKAQPLQRGDASSS
jgi:hypothetical protein